LVESTIATTPLKRLVSRKEIADMVCLLCSSTFDFVTGQTLIMDGGRSIHSIR
jgi:enoyl-[acyl-carrier-protein] reductase (NADH)